MTSTFDFPLRSGEPPRPEDCIDLGKFDAPTMLTNSDPEMGGNYDMYESYGTRLPKWAITRYTMRALREQPKPYRVRVKGLGEVFVGEEGWRVQ